MPGLHAFLFFGVLALFTLTAGALGTTLTGHARGRATDSQLSLRIALCASLGLIFAITLVPARGPNELQLLPLIRIVRGLTPPVKPSVVTNVVGNIFLFLPLGAALCLYGLRRRSTVLVGFCLSAAIEFTQLFIPGRKTSSDDVLCNTLGALVGFALASTWAVDRRASSR
jgi:glycopeptide antibiotics resistance protein